jgi:hypothetical protein
VIEARAILDADYRAPARRGDIHAAAAERPPLIAIIDGVFLATLPPPPLEVLDGIRSGIPFMGASSLGALRAVELAPFGMIGIGKIFEMYRSRRLVADDEVAVVFAGGDLRALSVPLVNVRYALSKARRAGMIEAADRDSLIRVAKRIYFPERSWPLILQHARRRIEQARLDALSAFIATHPCDLKREDAIRMLGVARDYLGAGRARCAS